MIKHLETIKVPVSVKYYPKLIQHYKTGTIALAVNSIRATVLVKRGAIGVGMDVVSFDTADWHDYNEPLTLQNE